MKKRSHAEMSNSATVGRLRRVLDQMSSASVRMLCASHSHHDAARCMNVSLASGIVRARADVQTVLDSLESCSRTAKARAAHAFELEFKQAVAHKEETSAGKKYARAVHAACDAALVGARPAQLLRTTPATLPASVSPCAAYISMRLVEHVHGKIVRMLMVVGAVPEQTHVMVAGEGTRFYRQSPHENLLRLKVADAAGNAFPWLDSMWMEAVWVNVDGADVEMQTATDNCAGTDALQTLRMSTVPAEEGSIAVAYSVAQPPCAAANHISIRIGTHVGNGGAQPYEFARFVVRPLFDVTRTVRCIHAFATPPNAIGLAVNASASALALVHADFIFVYTLPAYKRVRCYARAEGDAPFRAACFAARDMLYVLNANTLFRASWSNEALVRMHTLSPRLGFVQSDRRHDVLKRLKGDIVPRAAVAIAVHGDHVAISFEHKVIALFSLSKLSSAAGQPTQLLHPVRAVGLPGIHARDQTATNCLCFSPDGEKLLTRAFTSSNSRATEIIQVAASGDRAIAATPILPRSTFVDLAYDTAGNVLVLNRDMRQVQVHAAEDARVIAEWELPTKDVRALAVAGATVFVLANDRLMLFA